MNAYRVNRQRWAKRSLFEQLGNIGSEVGRAFGAQRHNNLGDRDAAIRRVLDLFNATAEQLVAQHSPRVREVLRARDQFLDQLYGNPITLPESLERYFNQFAFVARQDR